MSLTQPISPPIGQLISPLTQSSRSYGRTDGLTDTSLQAADQSFTSVPHARIPNDHDFAAKKAALRARHIPSRPPQATPSQTTRAATADGEPPY